MAVRLYSCTTLVQLYTRLSGFRSNRTKRPQISVCLSESVPRVDGLGAKAATAVIGEVSLFQHPRVIAPHPLNPDSSIKVCGLELRLQKISLERAALPLSPSKRALPHRKTENKSRTPENVHCQRPGFTITSHRALPLLVVSAGRVIII